MRYEDGNENSVQLLIRSPYVMLRGSHPTPPWHTAKALCQRHANIVILNAICISLHAFCHGTRGLSLEDEWECPVPPGRVVAGQSGVMGQKRNFIWVVSQTIQGKFQGVRYQLRVVTTHAPNKQLYRSFKFQFRSILNARVTKGVQRYSRCP